MGSIESRDLADPVAAARAERAWRIVCEPIADKSIKLLIVLAHERWLIGDNSVGEDGAKPDGDGAQSA